MAVVLVRSTLIHDYLDPNSLPRRTLSARPAPDGDRFGRQCRDGQRAFQVQARPCALPCDPGRNYRVSGAKLGLRAGSDRDPDRPDRPAERAEVGRQRSEPGGLWRRPAWQTHLAEGANHPFSIKNNISHGASLGTTTITAKGGNVNTRNTPADFGGGAGDVYEAPDTTFRDRANGDYSIGSGSIVRRAGAKHRCRDRSAGRYLSLLHRFHGPIRAGD